MSLKKVIISPNNKENINTNDLDSIKAHLTSDEINNYPVIKTIIKKIKKIKINPLGRQNLNLTPVNKIKDEKQLNLINKINSFSQIVYDYNKNQKFPKKIEEKVYKGQKNYNFSKLYNQIKENNNLEQNEMLEEIREKYIKKNVSLPDLEKKNLFKDNLLLINENNIKKSIKFKLSSNKKILSYLSRMQKNINNKIIRNERKILFPRINEEFKRTILITRKTIIRKKKGKIKYKKRRKNDIKSIKEAINNIDDLDYFFESNNQQYFNYLKNPESIKNSNLSSLLDISKEENDSNNKIIDKFKLKTTKNNNVDKSNYNESISGINNKKSQIYNLDSKVIIKQSSLKENYSVDNINPDDKKNLIALKKKILMK